MELPLTAKRMRHNGLIICTGPISGDNEIDLEVLFTCQSVQTIHKVRQPSVMYFEQTARQHKLVRY